MPRLTRTINTLVTLAILVVISGCLDDGGSGSTPPVSTSPPAPQAAAIVVGQRDLVLDAVGKSFAIDITPVDANGDPVAVMVSFAASDPTIVAVDTMGNITALGIGVTEVIASIDGSQTTSGNPIDIRVDVTVAELKPNAHLLPADAPQGIVIDRLTNDGGYVVRFSVDAAAYAIAAGDLVTTDDWGVVGRVLSANLADDTLELEVESGQPIDIIQNGAFQFNAAIDNFEFPTEVAIPVETQPVESNPTLTADAGSIQRDVGNLNRLLNVLFPGEFTTSISQGFKCKLSNRGTRAFNIETDLNPTIRFDGINYQVEQDALLGFANSGRVSVDANFIVTFDGRIDWDGQLRGSVVCKDTLAAPFIQEGPLVLSLPSGIGFSFTAEVDDLSGTVFVNGEMPISMLVGVGYDFDNGEFAFLDAPIELEADTSALDIRFDVPAVEDLDTVSGQLKFEAFGFSVLRAGAGLGTFFGIYKKFDSLKAGVRQTIDLASAERQARDDTFAAKAELDVFLKRDLADATSFFSAPPMVFVLPAVLAANALGVIDLETLLDYELSANLATTPVGMTTTPHDVLTVGEPADFSITLNPITWLGADQVDELLIYRIDGEGEFSILTEIERIDASPGQSNFEWNWTADEEDLGRVQFVPFVVSDFLIGQPIQVDDIFEVTVEGEETIPTPTVESFADGEVRINGDIGRFRDGRYEFERIGITEYADRQPISAIARASLEGMSAGATISFGQISLQLSLDGNICGNFNLYAGGGYDIDLRDFPAGTQIAVGGGLNGPQAYSVSFTPDDAPGLQELRVDVSAFASVDDDRPLQALEDSLSGEYTIRGSEEGWDDYESPFGLPRPYRGGGAGFGTDPLTLAEGSGRAEIDVSGEIFVQLDLPCRRDVESRRFNAAITINFSPVY
ncbi:MAG: hypothetical protein AAFN07_09050 [Pseudomonadota bacterium]